MARVFALRMPLSNANMSQSELARRLGVDPTTVSYWMSGKKKPTADRLPKIAEALNCTIDSLYTPEDHEVPTEPRKGGTETTCTKKTSTAGPA